MNRAPVVVALVALVCACPVAAAPKIETVSKVGENQAQKLSWTLHYLQFTGTPTPGQARINAALRSYIEPYMKAEPFEGEYTRSTSDVTMEVSALTDTLLSIEISSYFYSGGAHGVSGSEALTFDLRTGEQVPTRAFFAGGAHTMDDLAGRVAVALREDYTDGQGELLLELPTAKDLTDILVRPTGLTFMWPSYGLGAPYAMGPPRVDLSWGELGDTIYSSGVLGPLVKGKPTVIDHPLGGGFTPEVSAQELDYVKRLEVQSVNALTLLTPQERAALAVSSEWYGAASGRELLTALEREQQSRVATLLRQARSEARADSADLNFTSVLVKEASAFTNAIEFALQALESGVIIGADVPVLGSPNFAGDVGATIVSLSAETRVGVVQRAEGDSPYHRVRVSNGAVGRVHRKHLAIESLLSRTAPAFLDYSGDLTLGEDGFLLRSNDSAPQSRRVLLELKGLVEANEQTPPVSVRGVKVEHRGRTWFVPLAYRLADGADGSAPTAGVTSQLPH